MKGNKDLSALEGNEKFRKSYLPNYFWLRNPGIFPPSSLIFLALLGLIYLLNSDRLFTYYAIPFAVILVLGAIWLKMAKKLILKNLSNSADAYKVCLSTRITNENNISYIVFTTGTKRHNKYFIQTARKEIEESGLLQGEAFAALKSKSQKEIQLIPEEYTGGWDNILLKAIKKEVLNPVEENLYPVVYLTPKDIVPLKKRDIELYF